MIEMTLELSTQYKTVKNFSFRTSLGKYNLAITCFNQQIVLMYRQGKQIPDLRTGVARRAFPVLPLPCTNDRHRQSIMTFSPPLNQDAAPESFSTEHHR